MLSNKPYLIRAFYEWIVDSGCTPFVLINALFPRCQVPAEYIENNQITLNVSPTAVRDLKITKEMLECRASFSGVVHIISVPVKAVLAVYAQENQQGMFFDAEEESDSDSTSPEPIQIDSQPSSSIEKKRTSHLQLVE